MMVGHGEIQKVVPTQRRLIYLRLTQWWNLKRSTTLGDDGAWQRKISCTDAIAPESRAKLEQSITGHDNCACGGDTVSGTETTVQEKA